MMEAFKQLLKSKACSPRTASWDPSPNLPATFPSLQRPFESTLR